MQQSVPKLLAFLLVAGLLLAPVLVRADEFFPGPDDGVSFFQLDLSRGIPAQPHSSIGVLDVNLVILRANAGMAAGFLNLVVENEWVARNVVVRPEPFTPYAHLIVEFDLGTAGDTQVEILNAGLVLSDQPIQSIPVLDLEPFLMEARRRDVCDAPGAPVSRADTSPPDVTDLSFDEPAKTTTVVQLDHPNLEAADNQCLPMSAANSLQFLENSTNLTIPFNHAPGLRGDDTLVGLLDDAMDREVTTRRRGDPLDMIAGVQGRLNFLINKSLWPRLKRLRHWGSIDDIGDLDITATLGEQNAKSRAQGIPINFDALLNAMAAGEACEGAYFWPGGGQVFNIVAAGYTAGEPWLIESSDLDQRFDNAGAAEEGVQFSYLIDTNGDGDFNMNGSERELQFVLCQGFVPEVLEIGDAIPPGGTAWFIQGVEVETQEVTDPGNNIGLLGPLPRTADLTVDGNGNLMLDSASSWFGFVDDLDETGSIQRRLFLNLDLESEVSFDFGGRFTQEWLELTVTVGVEGELPGGQSIQLYFLIRPENYWPWAATFEPRDLSPHSYFNGISGDVYLQPGEPAAWSASMESGGRTDPVDWWVVSIHDSTQISYLSLLTGNWESGVQATLQAPLTNLPNIHVLNWPGSSEPARIDNFFAVDLVVDNDVTFPVLSFSVASAIVDGDDDGDNISNSTDNCPASPNPDMADESGCYKLIVFREGVGYCNTEACDYLNEDQWECSVCNIELDLGVKFTCPADGSCEKSGDSVSCFGCDIEGDGWELDCELECNVALAPPYPLICEDHCQFQSLQSTIACDSEQPCDINLFLHEGASASDFQTLLTLRKEIEGEGDGVFTFSSALFGHDYQVIFDAIATQNGIGAKPIYLFLNPGQLSIQELVPPGWRNSNIECDSETNVTTAPGESVALSLVVTSETASEITCIFFNEQVQDSDGDGVPDHIDICKNTSEDVPTPDANGCAKTIEAENGAAYCNDLSSCSIGMSGPNFVGVCADCAMRDNINKAFADCFGSGKTCQHFDDETKCTNCRIETQGGTVADCSGTGCAISPIGFNCTQCEVNTPGHEVVRCTDELPCEIVVRDILDGELPILIDLSQYYQVNIVVRKQVETGGDDSFRFIHTNPNLPIFGEKVEGTIATSSGVGTSEIQYVTYMPVYENPGSLKFSMQERIENGWLLHRVECDNTGGQNEFEQEQGKYKVDVLPGVPIIYCTFFNRRDNSNPIQDLSVAFAESISFTSNAFGTTGDLAVIAGQGIQFYDPATGGIPTVGTTLLRFDTTLYNDRYGATVSRNPIHAGSDGFFFWGQTGFALRQYLTSTEFGATLVSLIGEVTNAVAVNDVDNPYVLTTNFAFNQVLGHSWQSIGGQSFLIQLNTPLVNSFAVNQLNNGKVVTAAGWDIEISNDGAVTPDSDGGILGVTNGGDGSPGTIFVADPNNPFDTPVVVGEAGLNPLLMKCHSSKEVCVISNYDSDTLTIVLFDGFDTASVLGHVPVGNEPLGGDFLVNGDDLYFAVVNHGDNTWTRVTLNNNSVTETTTFDLPAGCLAPTGVAVLPDESGDALFVCKGDASGDSGLVRLNLFP